MKYWDSSGLTALLVKEDASNRMEDVLHTDSGIVTWWATYVECVSALTRLEREGRFSSGDARAALEVLRQSSQTWVEVPASVSVREQAIRLLRVHRLRAGDALQLAAAIVAADFTSSALEFVTLDTRQGDAAEREGFRVLS